LEEGTNYGESKMKNEKRNKQNTPEFPTSATDRIVGKKRG
jgi:hypothetical protein